MENDNTNRGKVWRANKHPQDLKKPDWTGKINWKGEEIDIALWHYPEDKAKGYKECYNIRLQDPRPKQEAPKIDVKLNDDGLPF